MDGDLLVENSKNRDAGYCLTALDLNQGHVTAGWEVYAPF